MEPLNSVDQPPLAIPNTCQAPLKVKVLSHEVTAANTTRKMPQGGRSKTVSSRLSASKVTSLSKTLKAQDAPNAPVLSFDQHKEQIENAQKRFDINIRLATALEQIAEVEEQDKLQEVGKDRGAVLLAKDLLIKSKIMKAIDVKNIKKLLLANSGKILLDKNNKKMNKQRFFYFEALKKVVDSKMMKVKENDDIEPFSHKEIEDFKRKYKGDELQVLRHISSDNPEPSDSGRKHPHKYSDYYWATRMINFVLDPKRTNAQVSSMSSNSDDSKAAEHQGMSASTSSSNEESLDQELHVILQRVRMLEATMQVPGAGPESLSTVTAHSGETKEVEQAPAKPETADDRSKLPGNFLDTQMDVNQYIAQLKQRLSGDKQRLILQFYSAAAETCMYKQRPQGYQVNAFRDTVYDLATNMIAAMELPQDQSARQLAKEVAKKLIEKVKETPHEAFCFKQYVHQRGISHEEQAEINAQEKGFRESDKKIIEGISAAIPAELSGTWNGQQSLPRKLK